VLFVIATEDSEELEQRDEEVEEIEVKRNGTVHRRFVCPADHVLGIDENHHADYEEKNRLNRHIKERAFQKKRR